ncbi:peptide/nickel transport system ATP-binding protein [Malonomonas rubra DSM 5091]|uniref:Peptide/nickel transport system ATP-binding protein n=1 Tax=Malonomonas rubra DSM 5091 TaxID=1122189 RepID=A0A1M6FET5_MALRU|nr:ABC transporter ATP-binding protein [Malonomonas rubra]SHI96175.1 peptide/nickel transport system ATP-binding protein [Malonomonas rubra DSM 5091]
MRSTRALPSKGKILSSDLILEVKDLQTVFITEEGVVKGCNGVSYSLKKGETLAVVGESGSGKSVTAMSILRLIPEPPGKIVGGQILFDGIDLVQATEKQMRKIRGNQIAMIFQEPMTSLNPVLTVGRQIGESLQLHQPELGKAATRARVIELLELVGIPSAEQRINEFPHQLSGGMKQRVMIAMALACNPRVLIADEPTSALDVTIQAQILNLIRKLQQQLGMSVIMITHDLAVVAETADSVAVMYGGRIVEYGSVDEIFHQAKHPYLEGLKRSMPRLDVEEEELYTIEGMVPNPLKLPSGCPFRPRCPQVMDRCCEEPPAISFSETHYARCWLYAEGGTDA